MEKFEKRRPEEIENGINQIQDTGYAEKRAYKEKSEREYITNLEAKEEDLRKKLSELYQGFEKKLKESPGLQGLNQRELKARYKQIVQELQQKAEDMQFLEQAKKGGEKQFYIALRAVFPGYRFESTNDRNLFQIFDVSDPNFYQKLAGLMIEQDLPRRSFDQDALHDLNEKKEDYEIREEQRRAERYLKEADYNYELAQRLAFLDQRESKYRDEISGDVVIISHNMDTIERELELAKKNIGEQVEDGRLQKYEEELTGSDICNILSLAAKYKIEVFMNALTAELRDGSRLSEEDKKELYQMFKDDDEDVARALAEKLLKVR